jgi:hypothetical protein
MSTIKECGYAYTFEELVKCEYGDESLTVEARTKTLITDNSSSLHEPVKTPKSEGRTVLLS